MIGYRKSGMVARDWGSYATRIVYYHGKRHEMGRWGRDRPYGPFFDAIETGRVSMTERNSSLADYWDQNRGGW